MSIPQNRLEILRELGFGDVPVCDCSYAFRTQTLALHAKMSVNGDHATDIAYIYYASVPCEDEVLDGLFYAPSLLEYMPVFAEREWHFDEMLEDICRTIGCEASVVGVGGFPMIFVPTCEYDFTKEQRLRDALSDMLKLIGICDYFLSRERENFIKQNVPNLTGGAL